MFKLFSFAEIKLQFVDKVKLKDEKETRTMFRVQNESETKDHRF